MNPEERQEILDLKQRGLSIRAIARKLGLDRKKIRTALGVPAAAPHLSKLDRFQEIIREKHAKGLSAPRILRELRPLGYTGSLTILKDFLRSLGPRKRARKAFRRFETKPAEEGQADWSPYRVPIAGIPTVVHCFSLILCFSRRMFMAFYRNERLPTLLCAHTDAFRYLGGLPTRLVYDNMGAVTVGRLDGKPLWNPTFLAFSKHHGFEPFAHRPRHKERSGKVERPFHYLENDFLKDSTFESWEDLQHRTRVWLDTIANVRKHSTTGRFIHEAYEEEKPLLISPAAVPFASERREVRKVLSDATVSLDASFYPVPASLVGRHVTIRVFPMHVEILDAAGDIVVRHAIPDRPMRVPAPPDPTPQDRERFSATVLESRFLALFPGAEPFLHGLKRRMNALTPIHLRRIERLVDLYGCVHVTSAIEHASSYGNYNAAALARILEQSHPDIVAEPPVAPLRQNDALGALDDVDSGSPEDYTLDSLPPTRPGDDDDEQA